jgi:CTP:phosphocholine cytidylyltransferase-like protein
MKVIGKILSILLGLAFIGQAHAQTFHPMFYIHTVRSANDKFFLKTIPFDNIEQTSTGKTIVYNSDLIHFTIRANETVFRGII